LPVSLTPTTPGVLRLVAAVCAGAGRAAVAVCGEFAADEQATQLLVGLGVGELSVAPRVVPALKQAVRALNRGHAATTAGLALDADSPQQVRALVAGRPAPQLVHPTRTAPPGDRHCCPERAGPPQILHRGDTPPEWRSAPDIESTTLGAPSPRCPTQTRLRRRPKTSASRPPSGVACRSRCPPKPLTVVSIRRTGYRDFGSLPLVSSGSTVLLATSDSVAVAC